MNGRRPAPPLLLLAAVVAACGQVKNTPKSGKLDQAVIVGGACQEHKKSVADGTRGLLRVDVIKNFRTGTAEVMGQGFVSKEALDKTNPYDLLSLDPRSKAGQRGLTLVDLGLTLDVYFKGETGRGELGVPSRVGREEFEERIEGADPEEIEAVRKSTVTLKGRREDVPGFFRTQSQRFEPLDVRAETETIDGLRGMGPYVSMVLLTKAEAIGGVELLIPSDPQPDGVDYEDPTQMPKGKIGGSLVVAFGDDPNRPEERYGSLFVDRSLVVEFQGKSRAGDWIRRCVTPDSGEATNVEIPLDATVMAGRAGAISVVLARKYRIAAPVPDEAGGNLYLEVNSAVVTGGAIAPADKS